MKRNLFAFAIAAAFAAPLALAAGNNETSGSSAPKSSSSAQSSQGATEGQQLSAAETFNRLDSNNDGYISKPEAGLMPDVIVIFPTADLDKDNKLSRSELDEGMKNRTASTQGRNASQGSSVPSKAGQGNAGYSGPSSGRGAVSDTEGVYSPKGDAGGDPLGASPAGRSGSGGGR